MFECDDYYPFGELISCGSTGTTTHKFTGYERDSETGLDNAQARYSSSSLGRFMSPDPVGIFVADATNPQTWNLYAYVNNSPLAFVDPTGTQSGLDYYNCPGGGGGNDCGGLFPVNWEQDFGFGTYYTMDGVPVSSSVGLSALSNFDAAAACPDNNCSVLTVGRLNGQWYEEFTIPCPPGTVAACTGTGVLPLADQSMWQQPQSQPPIWWLQTKVFVSTLGSNFVNEFKQGGCVNTFWEGVEQADILGPAISGDQSLPDTAIKAGAAGQALAYSAQRLLTTPLRSGAVRSTLELGETAAGAFGPGYFVGQELWGFFGKEVPAMVRGTCH